MDKTVRIWDPETGKPVGQDFKGHAKWVLGVAWEPYHCECLASGFNTDLANIGSSMERWHRPPCERKQRWHMQDMGGELGPYRARPERPQRVSELCPVGRHWYDLHRIPR